LAQQERRDRLVLQVLLVFKVPEVLKEQQVFLASQVFLAFLDLVEQVAFRVRRAEPALWEQLVHLDFQAQ
jgi:hypothetical protein